MILVHNILELDSGDSHITVSNADNVEGCIYAGTGNLYLSLNFVVNLKLLFKNKIP